VGPFKDVLVLIQKNSLLLVLSIFNKCKVGQFFLGMSYAFMLKLLIKLLYGRNDIVSGP